MLKSVAQFVYCVHVCEIQVDSFQRTNKQTNKQKTFTENWDRLN